MKESYWDMDYSNRILGKFLCTREVVKENRLHQASDYLVSEYKTRQNRRNREYEKYYVKHIRKILTSGNVARISTILNVLLLLWMFSHQRIGLGMLVSLSLLIFGSMYRDLDKTTTILRGGPFHANTFEYYERFLSSQKNRRERIRNYPQTAP